MWNFTNNIFLLFIIAIENYFKFYPIQFFVSVYQKNNEDEKW